MVSFRLNANFRLKQIAIVHQLYLELVSQIFQDRDHPVTLYFVHTFHMQIHRKNNFNYEVYYLKFINFYEVSLNYELFYLPHANS